MNIIKKIICGLAIAVGFASCQDLDVDPNGFYSEENFFNTVEEADAALIYAYDALTYIEYSRGVFYLGEIPSDNCSVKPDEGADAQAFQYWTVTGDNTILLNYYRYGYIAINRANAVIENVVDADFLEASKNSLLGQAYFLRAWNHFNMVRAFGLTPMQEGLVDKLDETTATMPESMDEVYNFLISDLEKSIDYLEVERVTGRADKVAAQALLAKVYLYAAASKANGVPLYDAISTSSDQLYSKAAEYSLDVLTGQSVYGHDGSLQNIYDVEKPDGSEHIFIMSMDRSGTTEGDYSKISKMFIPWFDGATIYLKNADGSFSPTHDGWSVYVPTDNFLDTFEDGDKRREQLFVSEVYDESGNSTGTVESGRVAYEFTRKYIDPDFEGDKTSTRPFLIRFSDIELIYAEATADASGLVYYNNIRSRAGLTELEDLSGLSVADFRELVVAERSYELAFEGDRLYDLRRTNTVQSSVPEASSISDMDAAFFPIPQREIDLNPNIE